MIFEAPSNPYHSVTPAWQTMATPKVRISPHLVEDHLHMISIDATTFKIYLL